MTIEELESEEVEEDEEWDVEPDFWEAIALLQTVYDTINAGGVELRKLTPTLRRRFSKVKQETADFLMQYETGEEEE